MKTLLLAFIRIYKACLSPALPTSCRFYPTCSTFAYQAIQEWGVRRGVAMALRRIWRCHPFGAFGYDPVPEKQGLGARD